MKTKINNKTVGNINTTREKIIMGINKGLIYLVLTLGALATLFPFYYMLVLATKSNTEIFSFPPPIWFGSSFSENIKTLLGALPFFRNILNSVFVATVSTGLTLFFCALGGYGFAKYNFRGKEKLFFLMLATMMIPGLLAIIPWFILMSELKWLNTFYPLIIPGIANAFGIFLMRQFMEDIPDDIMHSARIDGCGEFEIFIKIVLPMSLPALGTLGILTFLGSWNNYMQALLVLHENHLFTIPVALSKLGGKIDQNWGAQMAGTTLAIAPIVIAFIVASKQFISGITEGATKG